MKLKIYVYIEYVPFHLTSIGCDYNLCDDFCFTCFCVYPVFAKWRKIKKKLSFVIVPLSFFYKNVFPGRCHVTDSVCVIGQLLFGFYFRK